MLDVRASADLSVRDLVSGWICAPSDQEQTHKYLNGERLACAVCLRPQEGPKVPLCVLMIRQSLVEGLPKPTVNLR
jgi:hypothetical protein